MNDPVTETFEFKRANRSGLLVPIRYIKIVPISYVSLRRYVSIPLEEFHSAHSPNFNTSIWYVALSGVNEAQIVRHAQEAYTRVGRKVFPLHSLTISSTWNRILYDMF